MIVKGFLATDDNGDTYIYLIDDRNALYKDDAGDWQIADDYSEVECACIADSFEMRECFGVLSKYIEAALESVYIPTKDEEPIEIDINFSINWF